MGGLFWEEINPHGQTTTNLYLHDCVHGGTAGRRHLQPVVSFKPLLSELPCLDILFFLDLNSAPVESSLTAVAATLPVKSVVF